MNRHPKILAAAIILLCGLLPLNSCAVENSSPNTPRNRRDALVKLSQQGESAIPQIAAALQDENTIIRQTAIRLLAEMGEPAIDELAHALDTSDVFIRQNAIQALGLILGQEVPLDLLKKAAFDPSRYVRQAAIDPLIAYKPIEGGRLTLLQQVAAAEKDAGLRALAFNATWPFFKEVILLKNRQDWDHEVKMIQEMPMPKEDWAFATDAENQGHVKKWYESAFDDSQWQRIPIEKTWEESGSEYDGVAWYRRTFQAPEKPQNYNAVELKFDAVDECAWVWLNGSYVGQHNLGPAGWKTTFSLDITQEIKWGEENQITVRIQDTAGAGGIYKPVYLQIME